MNAPLDIRMDNQAFLHWVQGREGRFELERGRVVQQKTGGSRNHSILAARLIAAFSSRLEPSEWNVCTTDLAVEIGDSVRFPDVLLERAGLDGSGLSSPDPIVLVEILSPSSVVRDLKAKLAEYTALPSLQAYIVASQDEPIVWMWARDAQGHFASEPTELNGRETMLTIAYLNISMPLAELYRGIGRQP